MSLRRNTFYNLTGSAIPVVAALITIPLYIRLISPVRYGVLATVWAFLGYFGFFDLGLGRATAFRIAALRDAPASQRAAAFHSALVVNVAMGSAGGALLWFVSAYYYQHWFKVGAGLRPEIVAATPWLALCFPVAALSGVLTGALQGRERFLAINIISVTSALLFQALPLAVAWLHGPNLSWIVAAALGARCVALAMLGYFCYVEVIRGHRPRVDATELPLLLRYGGWVTVASMFAPLVAWSDRFIIGAMIGAFAVAVYATPMQFAKQVQILPAALSNALFPRIAAATAAARRKYASDAIHNIMILTTAPVLALIFLVGPAMWHWIGPDLAVPGTPVARILLIGFWLNALAIVPYTTAQASGRPDLVTKILMFETVPYLIAVYLGLTYFGVTGAAMAFLFRCVLDYLLLSWFSHREFFGAKFVALNLVFLTIGAELAAHYGLGQWPYWTGLIVLQGVVLTAGWRSMPSETRLYVSSLLQRLTVGRGRILGDQPEL